MTVATLVHPYRSYAFSVYTRLVVPSLNLLPQEIIPRSESRSARTGIPLGFFDDVSLHVRSTQCTVTKCISRLKELIHPADPRMEVHCTPYGTHASRTSSTASRFTGNCNKHRTRRGVHATGTDSRNFCDSAFPPVDPAKVLFTPLTLLANCYPIASCCCQTAGTQETCQ
jgi:hypothetical protein